MAVTISTVVNRPNCKAVILCRLTHQMTTNAYGICSQKRIRISDTSRFLSGALSRLKP